ncbi:MAG TPA: hypothetical protein VFE43_02825 [Candidatus Binataceae bacterium]|jgi:hypothetical protein|nr:hypothetical protein [Candidatus Binataceae bacterium]
MSRWRRNRFAAGCLVAALTASLAFPRAAVAGPLSQSQFQALNDKLSNEVGYYLGAEEEKHADGKPYIDLGQRFEYMPSRGRGGAMVIHAKIGGAEYVPNKGEMTKGIATGKLKYLVFTYALHGGEWTEVAKPLWQTQMLGQKAAQRMTEAAARDEAAEAAARERELRGTPAAPAHPAAAPAPTAAPNPAASAPQ